MTKTLSRSVFFLAALLIVLLAWGDDTSDHIELRYYPGFSAKASFITVRITDHDSDPRNNTVFLAFEKLKEIDQIEGPIEILPDDYPHISIEVTHQGQTKLAVNAPDFRDRGNEAFGNLWRELYLVVWREIESQISPQSPNKSLNTEASDAGSG